MALTLLSGRIEIKSKGSQETQGTGASVAMLGNIGYPSFRINNQPITLKLNQYGNLSDGDFVTVVGETKDTIFEAVGLRNELDGAIYINTVLEMAYKAIIISLLVFALLTFGFTLLFVIFPYRNYKKIKQVKKLLQEAPRVTSDTK